MESQSTTLNQQVPRAEPVEALEEALVVFPWTRVKEEGAEIRVIVFIYSFLVAKFLIF